MKNFCTEIYFNSILHTYFECKFTSGKQQQYLIQRNIYMLDMVTPISDLQIPTYLIYFCNFCIFMKLENENAMPQYKQNIW